jgi:hypothetical protein
MVCPYHGTAPSNSKAKTWANGQRILLNEEKLHPKRSHTVILFIQYSSNDIVTEMEKKLVVVGGKGQRGMATKGPCRSRNVLCLSWYWIHIHGPTCVINCMELNTHIQILRALLKATFCHQLRGKNSLRIYKNKRLLQFLSFFNQF